MTPEELEARRLTMRLVEKVYGRMTPEDEREVREGIELGLRLYRRIRPFVRPALVVGAVVLAAYLLRLAVSP